MAKEKKRSGGARKIGRDKNKCASYRAYHTREKNKVPRIARSSLEAAMRYADKFGLHTWAQTRLKDFAKSKERRISNV